MKIDKKEVGLRLKRLRQSKKWSLNDLAQELHKKIDIDWDYETGKSTISAIEGGRRGFKLDTAIAFAELFDVSLDYIYGRIPDWKPEYKEIKKQIGLSDGTISKLEYMKNNDKTLLSILDYLLNPANKTSFIEYLGALHEHKVKLQKTLIDKSNMAKGVPYFLADRTINKPDDYRYISLFKITKIAEKIADELIVKEK